MYLPNEFHFFIDGEELIDATIYDSETIKMPYHPQILRFDGQLKDNNNFNWANFDENLGGS